MRVLVVDDDQAFAQVLAGHLENEGYDLVRAAGGREALRSAYQSKPDLILLDLRMPDMSGLEACERLRELCRVPIIILSVMDDEEVVVRALRSGADDYLVKPFSIVELKARLRAVMRRATGGQVEVPLRYQDDSLQIDLVARRVYKNGQRVSLSPTEIKLLYHLLERRGQVVLHDELISAVWGPESDKDRHHHLSLYMSYLRKKIEDDPRAPRYLRTRYGKGYWFAGAGASSPL